MKTSYLLTIGLFLGIIFSSDAQKISKKAKHEFNKGMGFFNAGDYNQALKHFLAGDNFYNNDPKVAYYIGLSYSELHSFKKAAPYFERAKKFEYEDRELYFYLGKAYHQTHRFMDALAEYETFYGLLKASERARKAEIEHLIQNCKYGFELMYSTLEIDIKNLGGEVNSKYPDYNPVISADESSLVFTSRRENSTGKMIDQQDGMFFEDIYIVNKEKSKKWGTATGVSKQINTDSHDACIGLSADGQEMLIYKATSNGGDIYISYLKGENWTEPKDLGPNINSPGWESSGSISSDNQVLFFTSDRKEGYGGTDIYMSRKTENGEFGPAILLGPQINTPEDELSPFIHADGKTLYFSSRGHNSMGGFDIFSVKVDLETGEILSRPENIGYPINTADDDTYFVWSADNTRAYFSSFREGGLGDKDIYMLERNIAMAPLVVWKGRIYDCVNESTLDSRVIVTDNITKKLVGIFTPNSSTGKYVIILPSGRNYNIAIEAKNYSFFSKNLDIPDLDTYLEINEDICLNPIMKGTKIVLRNVFFDFDKATLRSESETELTRILNFMNTNPFIKLEISGHTDDDGDANYNVDLSQRRAKAVYDYLVSKGINKNRLRTVGYGATQPLVPNDSPDNKQLNRRTELMIIE